MPTGPKSRTLVKVGLAPLIIILAIVTVFVLDQHGHNPAQLTSQPPATGPLVTSGSQDSAPPDTQSSASDAAGNQPSTVPITSISATEALLYDKTAGVGCSDTPGTSVFQDLGTRRTHLWASASAITWNVQDCQNALVATTPTTDANPDLWQNDYGWNFHDIPTSAACTFHIYIADSPDSQYHADYYWTTGDPNYVEDNDFHLDQSNLRGTWVTRGPFNFPTGEAMLEMTDARTTGPNAPMTASVARLTCT